MEFSEDKVNVFISYAHEDEPHNQWVSELANIIDEAGGNSITDAKLPYGGHFRLFMETKIKQSDIVLIILTPSYKEKADSLKGGVGYEVNIITPLLFKVIHNNEKFIPVLRKGDFELSVCDFLKEYKYPDLRPGKEYEKNLKALLQQILKTPLNSPQTKPKSNHMEQEYLPFEQLLPELDEKLETYFNQIFDLTNSDNVFSAQLTEAKVKATFSDWENDVQEYSSSIREVFSPEKLEIYETILGDFKSKIFRDSLWTVHAALKSYNEDLARYKRDYADALPDEILTTLRNILQTSNSYVEDIAKNLNYDSINEVEDLKFDFLDNEELFMTRIIGYGIRSEILHRYYPAYFPIMTQKSLWALYFMSDSADEFITIEQKTRKGLMRVSHNWQYDYARWTYIMNHMTQTLGKLFAPFDCKTIDNYRFGYTNMFLSEIHKMHKKDINMLHAWEEMEYK